MQRVGDHFDIVLVLDYFRIGGPHLCIVKALAARFRIGLYCMPLDESHLKKADRRQGQFVAAMQEAGAEIVKGLGHSCDLMIVQQRQYTDAAAKDALRAIRPLRIVGLMSLAMAGIENDERYLKQFGIDKVYVPSERFRRFLVARRGGEHLYDGVAVEQVGLPYARVALEPDFHADWIIATPTGFSFRRENHKHAFLRTVLRLLHQIGPQDRIVYKPHNGEHRDYLAPPVYARVADALRRIPGTAFVARIGSLLPGRVGHHAAKMYTAILHERVLRPKYSRSTQRWREIGFHLRLSCPACARGLLGG